MLLILLIIQIMNDVENDVAQNCIAYVGAKFVIKWNDCPYSDKYTYIIEMDKKWNNENSIS